MAKNCSLFPDNPDYCTTIVVVKRVLAVLSMIGCLFIIFIIWLFKKYKYFTQRLILSMSIAALLDVSSFLMGDLQPEDGPACVFQAWWLSFFDFAVLLWVSCMTFNLYWNAIKKVRTERFEKWYHVCSWGISLIIACIPLFGNRYGPAGAWCWIRHDMPNSTVWRMMMWYVPLFIMVFAMFATYIYIFIVYRRQAKTWAGTYNAEDERNRAMMKEHVKPLMSYPCIYLVTSMFPLAHRIYNASTDVPSFPLLLLHVISNPLAGALFAIVFGMDKETFSRLNWPQIKVAFAQHSRARKPLVREYPVGDATEVRPNDDSSWSTTSSNSPPALPQESNIPPGDGVVGTAEDSEETGSNIKSE